ncbi:MAG TPA: GDSL-type esterase/lipase family protein [Bryobacteraceae bacterium]|nr:GDSL-type esterase/lipase family protein [Bryobacteraceae bacterium]
MMKGFPLQTALTILSLPVLLGLARLVAPAIKGPEPAQFQAIVDFAPERVPMSPLSRRVEPEPSILPRLKVPGMSALLDDSGGALDHFYQSLWRTERREKDAVTRVVHYGDSPTTADLITGDIRSQLQKRYGDGGHGFVLLAKPWAWYQHTAVQLSASGWQMSPATHFETHDGIFGLGGVSFTGSGSAYSKIVFENPGHSRFEVWFMRQPGGGAFSVSADGKSLGRVETAADEKAPGFASFDVEPSAGEIEIQVEEGNARLFGLTAAKPGPGVIYDSLGLNGASITVLSRIFNQDHWAAELSHRNPDLVIVNYGTNEADFAAFIEHGYEKELREVIQRIRNAVPESSILVMSPMDRGHRVDGEIETMPTIPRIVAIQRRVAKETGCGFFDTFTAMGGEGTMAHWYNDQPRLVSADFIHPYPAGGKRIATAFTKELGAGLNRFKLQQLRQQEASNRSPVAVP